MRSRSEGSRRPPPGVAGREEAASLSILLKPVSGRCNLACRYCFYREVAERRSTGDYGLMEPGTAELLVDRAFETGASHISFGFQGGEPTLAGLDFFRRFVGRVRRGTEEAKAAGRGIEVNLALQTNGLLIDEAWATFLAGEGFLVGVSIDGPRLLHDSLRIGRDGSGSHAAAMRGVSILREAGVPVNALCVVDALTAGNAARVYAHLREKGFDWLQFIPCLDPPGEEGGHTWSLTPEDYGSFLAETFDLRYGEWRRGSRVNVRWFDDLVGMAMGNPPESCGMRGFCGSSLAVESDGSAYTCDFYMTDEWKLGDIRRDSIAAMLGSPAARRFVDRSRRIDPACAACPAFSLCRGGCLRYREPFADGRPSLNRYCSSFKRFFGHATPRLLEMAACEKTAADESSSRA